MESAKFKCECGKACASKAGLSNHKRTCVFKPATQEEKSIKITPAAEEGQLQPAQEPAE